ncbi:hypothetical protein CGCSCA4_v002382 [Colletotrichum siamense]|uniref:Uncharacterized protein n=1 Tax=Colletotrichum siamense TaxID=690259 RepID=A0A9P5F1B2_COLSI|nr:hypothetical protein CGCSCA4_v002382 [Colletotrichum siamense]KAF4863883.1 hypothetical protein CGCSCA2_v002517 [Colletotrichum siamense]
MSITLIDELTESSIKKLARYLYLPTNYSIANPPDEWFREQEAKLSQLPKVMLRPKTNSLNVIDMMKRGLMNVTARQSLPFVPDAAMLCHTHKALNPWRMRCLFALLASEVTDKFERMRRLVRNKSDLAQEPDYQEYVRRVTSIQGLWMDRATFEQLYGYPPVKTERVRSQCEACMCAVVGGDTRLLVDLRAHLLSRAGSYQPVFLRVVNAWIDAFEQGAGGLHAESAVLGEKLRAIRREIGVRRYERRERARRAGKSIPYSKAKRDDNSSASLPPKTEWGSSGRPSTASGPARGYDSRHGQHTPETSHPRSNHSSRVSGNTPSPRQNPFEDDFEDDEVNEGDETNAGNAFWQDEMNNYYERQAAQNGGRSFDRASIHPGLFGRESREALQHAPEPSQSRKETPVSQQTSASATPRDSARNSRHSAHAPPPTSSSRHQSDAARHSYPRDASGRQSIRKFDQSIRPPPTPSQDTRVPRIPNTYHSADYRPGDIRRPTTPSVGTSEHQKQTSLSATRMETLGQNAVSQQAPSLRRRPSTTSAYSVPASMIQRESQARAELQEIANTLGRDNKGAHDDNSSASPANQRSARSTNHSSTRASEAVSSPSSRRANNPVTQDVTAAGVNRPPAPVATVRRPQEAVSGAASTARKAWEAKFAAESLNGSSSGSRGGHGSGSRSSWSSTVESRRTSVSHPPTVFSGQSRREDAVSSSSTPPSEHARPPPANQDHIWSQIMGGFRNGHDRYADDAQTVIYGDSQR